MNVKNVLILLLAVSFLIAPVFAETPAEVIAPITGLIDLFRLALTTLFSIGFLGSAGYFVLSQDDPIARTKAKTAMVGCVIGVLVFLMGPLFVGYMMQYAPSVVP